MPDQSDNWSLRGIIGVFTKLGFFDPSKDRRIQGVVVEGPGGYKLDGDQHVVYEAIHVRFRFLVDAVYLLDLGSRVRGQHVEEGVDGGANFSVFLFDSHASICRFISSSDIARNWGVRDISIVQTGI